MSSLPRLARRWHRIGAVLTALPFLVVILSGILLQMKKEWNWIQPPTLQGTTDAPSLSFARMLAIAQTIPEVGVRGWQDLDRIDVRPAKGILKLRCKNGMELQLDSVSGAVLQVARRRSDLIENIHDGSWFHPLVKLWLFLPLAVVLFLLWLTGVYLWWLPHGVRRRKRLQSAKRPPPTGG